MYDTILFDLDGTLTDPGEGITNSVAYALERYGIHNTDRRELYCFIGPPLLESFQKFYGLTYEQADQGVNYYREYYGTKGIFENKVIDGIPQLLEHLKAAGKRLIVATSKPEGYSNQILEHYGLAQYFDFVAGALMDNSRTDKAKVIAYAMEQCGITASDNVIMVGDREHDVIGAKKNGLACVGVLFGYGSAEELTAAGAVKLAKDAKELEEILLG
jgi:phosphoglycolate phosphatase